jgi:hypothetical protein
MLLQGKATDYQGCCSSEIQQRRAAQAIARGKSPEILGLAQKFHLLPKAFT